MFSISCPNFAMRNLTATFCLTIAVLFGVAGCVADGNNRGVTAAETGDYDTAKREFTPVAEQGRVKGGNLGNSSSPNIDSFVYRGIVPRQGCQSCY